MLWIFIVLLFVALIIFWRPSRHAKLWIKWSRYSIIGILLFIIAAPFILYFVLGGNPRLDFLAERLVYGDYQTSYYKYDDKIFIQSQNGLGVKRDFLSNVDATSFKLKGPNWATDANNVYYNSSIIKDADPATFSLQENRIGSDSQAVYIRTKNWGDNQFTRFTELDIDTLEKLGEFYFKDYNTVIYLDSNTSNGYKILSEADAPSFQMVSGVGSRYDPQVAKDKNYVWVDGKRQPGITP